MVDFLAFCLVAGWVVAPVAAVYCFAKAFGALVDLLDPDD